MSYTVAAFYRFTPLADPALLRATLLDQFVPLELRGSLLLAPEGVNATVAGSAAAIDAMLAILAELTGLSRDEVKFSQSPHQPFNRLRIRLKREIITFKQPAADPASLPGTYVEPRDWNRLIADKDVTVIDTRNRYETAIGIFDGACDPQIDFFTDFAAYVRAQLDPAQQKKVAIYCTGGIRCEKAAAFMRAEGFAQVYHLKGGILKYLEEVPAEQSAWRGDCFVFDQRIAVDHALKPGDYILCEECGSALTPQDRTHPQYQAGISCSYCHQLDRRDAPKGKLARSPAQAE